MEDVIKRKRGRPRKNPIPVVEAPIEVPKRPRGRPRKIAPVITAEVLPVKKRRGRPPKNAALQPEAKPAAVVKKNYFIVNLSDLEFWAETTDRDMFKQAVTDCNKVKKSKRKPEARWYKDRIEVTPV
jgi:hypothetical protein